METFEFHFNPEDKDKLVFDSFFFIPENIYEKRMGGIFMLGELKNPLPHNYKLLEKTAAAVKKEFYLKFHRSHEQALKESLKRGNEVLSAEVAKENTDWLDNFNFAIISLKNFELNFTKVGAIKMFIIRGPHIMDIGAKLDSQEIEPYPLKIFNNIVSGKLRENDVILAFSEEIFQVLKNIIGKIANLIDSKQAISPFDEKELKDLIKTKEKELAEVSGVFVLINVVKSPATLKGPKIIFQRERERFRAVQIFSPISKYQKKAAALFGNISNLATRLLKRNEKIPAAKPVASPSAPVKIKVKVEEGKPKPNAFKLPVLKFKLPALRMPVIKMPVFLMPSFKFSELKKNQVLKKKSVLILLFIFVLTLGFFIFQEQEKQKQKKYLAEFQIIQEKVSQAESYMILKELNPEAKKQALLLLSSAWDEVIPLTKFTGLIKNEALSLKEKIDDDLKNLNNLIKIDEPELIFEFSKQEYAPQKIVYDEKNLYFFSQYEQNIYKLDENIEGHLIQENQKFSKTDADESGSVLLFSKPDTLTLMENGQIKEEIALKLPYPDFNPADFSVFQKNTYFLDARNARIIKYLSPIANNKDNPQKWSDDGSQYLLDAKSITVDGSVWILDKDNNLLRYYAGDLQEILNPDIFPKPKSFSKILIPFGSPYIFVLEPSQKRVIIFDKQGKVLKQFESEKFNDLLDFTVSQNDKTIWLLNGLKVYKINF